MSDNREDTMSDESTDLEEAAPPAPSATPAGWYADAHAAGHERYWDGERWTDARRKVEEGSAAGGVTADYRRAVLSSKLAEIVAQTGSRIESQSDFQAVVVSGRPVNHVLHLLLTIFTLGLWLIPWIIIALAGGERRRIVTVDEYGNAQVQNAR